MKNRNIILFLQKLRYNLFLNICVFVILSIMMIGSIFFSGKNIDTDHTDINKYYTSLEIKKGDTLWSIASEYGIDAYSDLQTYVAEVKALNNLKGDTIHSGQFLVIPYYSHDLK
ncbi:MAG: LysM peptidoglycan-binding domain-containing protein [Lachnospiraceae bacterium]|nr:LysM peptidoglycan-binding domain-containing protein [Lachnospiraceae bacterium]